MTDLRDTRLWRAGRRWAGGFGLLLAASTSPLAAAGAECAAPAGCATISSPPAGCAATAGPDCCALADKNARDMRAAYDRLAASATGCGAVATSCAPAAPCGPAACAAPTGCVETYGATCDNGCDGGCDGAGCFGGLGGGGIAGLPSIPTANMVLWGDDDATDAPFSVGGWVQSGYHNGSTGQFNNRPGNYANHQSWIYLERAAQGFDDCGNAQLGFGFRADVMYGLDADDTQSFGNNIGNFDFQDGDDNFFNRGSYGWAIPQLYAEAAYGDFSVIAGHFYTLLGYEVVPAPDNFFYSHAFTMYNAEAFTHTGVLSTWNPGQGDLTFYNGYTFGWDTGFDQFQDVDGSEGSNYLGGVSAALTDNLTLTYILTAGDLGFAGEGYSHSVVADLQVTDRLNYVFQTDYFDTNQAALREGIDNPQVPFINEFDTAQVQLYSVNQYLFYTVNDVLSVGGRAEWFKVDGDSIYEITGGVNVRPMDNFVIRPEYRYQFGDEDGFANIGDGTSEVDEGIFAVDAIYTF